MLHLIPNVNAIISLCARAGPAKNYREPGDDAFDKEGVVLGGLR
jgi:hypothetical protein